MRKVLLLILLVSPFISLSQYRWDFGANLGGTGYLGEIGGGAGVGKNFSPADLKLQKTRYIAGGFARYKYRQFLSFKGNLNFIRLSGDDALSSNYGRRGRNLSFRNDLIEAEGVAQVFFAQLRDVGGNYKYRNDVRFYAFGGISVFYSNPKAKFEGSYVALRPLQTEGKAYGPVSFGLPLGLGAYITIQRLIRVGIEVAYVKTLTDYIDDVSKTYVDPSALSSPTSVALANRTSEFTSDPAYLAQYTPGSKRGDPTHKDTYLYTALTGSYVMKGKSAFYKSRYGGHFKGKGFKKRRVRAKF